MMLRMWNVEMMILTIFMRRVKQIKVMNIKMLMRKNNQVMNKYNIQNTLYQKTTTFNT